jgi:SAM-dependent methyltransferase
MSNNLYDSYYTGLDTQTWQWRELGGSVKANNIIKIADKISVHSILDIGCGTGAILAQLFQSGFGNQYYAIDVAQAAVDIVKQRNDIPKLCEARVFDGLTVPYATKQFDLAILSHVIEHLDDPTPLIREAVRVAHYVVIEVPLEANLYTVIKVHLLKSRYREEIGHIQWFSQNSFLRLLQDNCGLQIIEDRLVSMPSQVYSFRKQGIARTFVHAQLGLRRILSGISTTVYTRLLTDHYIALACEARNSPL